MLRGTVVKTNENDFFIFLSESDEVAKVALVEELYDENDAQFKVRVTSIKSVPSNSIEIAKKYPSYFNSINIA